MDTKNEAFAANVERELQDIIQEHCIHITPENFFKKTSFLKKILQSVAYETIRVLFFLFTFYFKREK
jgi:cardiolipin synthase